MSKIQMIPGPAIFKYLNTAGWGNLYSDHQFLWSLFPGDAEAERDFLFRKEMKHGYPVYYVVSKRIPSADNLLFHIETKKYNPVVKVREKYAFSLRVNPVVAKKEEGARNSKRHDVWMNAWRDGKSLGYDDDKLALYVDTTSKQWLLARTEKLGFAVKPSDIVVEGYIRHKFYRNKKKPNISISTLDYSGVLSVVNEKLMCTSLSEGIGKAKAFGCGLLLIKRL